SWPLNINLYDCDKDNVTIGVFVKLDHLHVAGLAECRVAVVGEPNEYLCDLRRLGWLLELLDVLHCCCHHRNSFRYRRPRRRVGELSGGAGMGEGWIRTAGWLRRPRPPGPGPGPAGASRPRASPPGPRRGHREP